MSPSFMFQAAVLIALSVAGTHYLAGNVETDEVVIEREVIAQDTVELSKGSLVTIPRTNGQFFTHGRVNSGSVHFLIDTGASTVALTPEDALKAGIRMHELTFDRPVDTANGRTMGASVMLRDVSLGGIRVTNVEAIVLREGLTISLLGMTFLGQLQKVEVMPNQMVLRR